ncbi:MAG: flagellar assembly protein FliW [Candidatus Gastranaerophilales bacterium]|nr:flagellar assembly protein FliW [Candidatus Gastranaerophilales bacterium]
MKIPSEKLGEIEIDEKSIINFVSPIIGFEKIKKYVIVKLSENDKFSWLQSVDNDSVTFPITVPQAFDIDYTFEIDDNNQKLLNLNDANDLLTFNIVNIPLNRPEDATINLLAPIVVNIKENIGAQLILSGSNHLPNKRLFEA